MKQYVWKWWPVFALGSVLWLILSVIFRNDRLYGDAAFYLFNCINDLALFTAHNRPAGALVQILPLILAKSNAEMNSIIFAFSLNEALLVVLLSLIPMIFFKDARLSVAMILPLFLGVKWNYFNPVSELVLCTPVFIGTFGLLWKLPDSKIVRWLFIPLTVFVILSHPLYYLLIPTTYLIFILERKLPFRWIILHLACILSVISLRVLNTDSYEQQQALGTSTISFSQLLSHYFNWSSASTILMSFSAMIVVAILAFYNLNKSLKPITMFYSGLLTLGFFAGVLYKFYFLFPDTYEPFERYLFPVSLLVGLFFYFDSGNGKAFLIVLPVVLIFQSVFIFNYGKSVQRRNQQLLNVIEYAQEHHLSKVVAGYFNFNPSRLGHDWSMTAESILLSKASGNHHSVQVAIYESFDKNLLQHITKDQYVHFPWWAISESELNPEYFYLYHQPYQLINTVDSSNYQNLKFSNRIVVSLVEKSYSRNRHSRKVMMQILNNSSEVLHSGINPNLLMVGGVWFKDGKEIRVAGEVPLLADLSKGHLNQYFNLYTDLEQGNYVLQYYLKYNGMVIANLNTQRNICIE